MTHCGMLKGTTQAKTTSSNEPVALIYTCLKIKCKSVNQYNSQLGYSEDIFDLVTTT